MTETVDVQAIADKMRAGYAALEAALAPLSEQRMIAPGAMGEWSVKDVLAHLTVWHWRLLDLLEPVQPKRVPEIPDRGLDDEEVEQFNEQIYQKHREDALEEVLEAFRRSYREVEQAVQRLSQEDLLAGGRLAWLDQTTLLAIIAGDTYDHYQEHLEAMRGWL